MMGQHKSDPQLFNYAVNLEKRVRAAHPLRRVKATIDFGFVREEVARCYGEERERVGRARGDLEDDVLALLIGTKQ